MSKRTLLDSFRYAGDGLRAAFRAERNFRIHLVLAALAILASVVLQVSLIWLALVVIMIGLVLAAELFNTALEHALDAAHPNPSPLVKIAKDCSAAAVLVLSAAAVLVFLLMLCARETV